MELLEQKIFALFVKKGWTLSLAESCTGGALAHKLVTIPEASRYFQGSVVAYSNEAKEEILGVKKETLEQFGAVSPEVALEMAQGALLRFRTTYALSVTGIAGPSGGSHEKPVGTVCFALVSLKKRESWTQVFPGNRLEIMDKAVKEGCQRLHLLSSSDLHLGL